MLDADVTSFFDAVPWDRLEGKLRALFPLDPLVDLAMEWVKSPVVFEGRTIERARGLPQGAAISPLLANLYLDELDEELLGKDYRLVRYADDFVVLAKDLDATRQAAADARAALAKLGLALNPEKTDVRSIDAGFSYLGYLFCRSLVLEEERPKAGADPPLPADAVPEASWLAQVPFEQVREVVRGRMRPKATVEIVPLAAPGGPPPRDALYVLTPGTRLWLREDTLMVEAPGTKAQTVPIRRLEQVVLCGYVRASLPLLLRLGRFGVPAYFCRPSGDLQNVFQPHDPQWEVWQAQGRAAADNALRLRFSREVVAAKLHNYAAIMVRYELRGGDEAAREVRDLARSCENKASLDVLRGLEGRGAAIYFEVARASLAPEWGFAGRRARPAPDPVNAMLSFGYTVLYNHISTALLAAGLNPRIGLFHTENGTYHALACDLQEEFRHQVDGLVWAMIHRGQAKPGDFAPSADGRYPCLMTHQFRRSFLTELGKRLLTAFTPPGGPEQTYRAFMDRQARRIRDLVQARATTYDALRAHS